MNIVKDYKELYDKTNEHFKDKAEWNAFGKGSPTAASCLSKCARLGSNPRTRYGKLMQSKYDQAPKEMTKRQNWIQDKFNFLKTPIIHKGFSKSSSFKSPARGASDIHCLSTFHLQRFNQHG